jgi:hypothetical protein
MLLLLDSGWQCVFSFSHTFDDSWTSLTAQIFFDDRRYWFFPVLAGGHTLERVAQKNVIALTEDWFGEVTGKSWTFTRKQGSVSWLLDWTQRNSFDSLILIWLASCYMKHGPIRHLSPWSRRSIWHTGKSRFHLTPEGRPQKAGFTGNCS